MSLHILGICGTFMGGLAALARELGIAVSGSDRDIYPPMSTQLEALGIPLKPGYEPAHLDPPPELVLVGNALIRGNPAIEHVLDHRLDYQSGPQWLGERVLRGRDVYAVAGTHGKTTTTAMLAWILDQAGLAPGFLVGGVPGNFPVSARLGDGRAFVVEADEYDTAFFDKRSKFVHYHPWVAVLNNLEYDHADIFPDLAAIERQFHHLVRIVPRSGLIVANGDDANLARVLAVGAWTPVVRYSLADRDADWYAEAQSADASDFVVFRAGQPVGRVRWSMIGRHNVANALAALAASERAGVDIDVALRALATFRGPRRRLDDLGVHAGVQVWDDFAHHPTAIATTLAGLRARVGGARIVVALEPRSNSMRSGAHAADLPAALDAADRVVILARADLGWDAGPIAARLGGRGAVAADIDALFEAVANGLAPGDHVVFMSNGAFDGAPRRLVALLADRTRS